VNLDKSLRIETNPGVYAPAEDSFLLLSAISVRKGERVLDMGTGTGIIALHCAIAGCRVLAADVSPEAVACARANAKANDLDLRVVLSDLFGNVEGKFDVIAFNPPYLSSEGSDALPQEERGPLIGGEAGHETTAGFLAAAREHLTADGRIYLLTSTESEAGVLEAADGVYSIRKVGSRGMFFESLAAWELKSLK